MDFIYIYEECRNNFVQLLLFKQTIFKLDFQEKNLNHGSPDHLAGALNH